MASICHLWYNNIHMKIKKCFEVRVKDNTSGLCNEYIFAIDLKEAIGFANRRLNLIDEVVEMDFEMCMGSTMEDV